MRHATPKTAKANRQRAKLTAAALEEYPDCQNPECETPHSPKHLHEIVGGCERQKTKMFRIAQLVLCDICNCGEFCDRKKWPVPRQLALQLLVSPQHFDYKAFCLLLNKNAPKKYDGDDILPYVRELLITFPGIAIGGSYGDGRETEV